MSTVRLLTSDDRGLFAECGNVFVHLAMRQEVPETFAVAEGHVHSLVGRHPKGIGYLLLVDHTEGPPDGYLERMRQIHRGIEAELKGVAVVVLPEGFAASIYRSTGAAYIALSGRRSLLHITGDPEDGASWLAERLAGLPGSPSDTDLTDAVGELRARRAG